MKRGAGIVLHISSLASGFGIGDLGPAAYQFADFLEKAGARCWQVLPLNPTRPEYGNCPYNSPSAFAGNTILISPEFLVRDGLLSWLDLKNPPGFPKDRTDYAQVHAYKEKLFDTAYENFKKLPDKSGYDRFCAENSEWLFDYALFLTLKRSLPARSWNQWSSDLRDRKPVILEKFREQFRPEMEKEQFLQWVFFAQWFALRDYCRSKGITIIGDIPIYLNFESAEVWSRPDLFKLDAEKKPTVVSGVPPDYFSKTGQLWGNPVYDWERRRESGYDWWIKRIGHNLRFFDYIRLDHFRGFVDYWEVPPGEKTAVNGKWMRGPGYEFFDRLFGRFPSLPLIAEDLGIISDEVRNLIGHYGFPGMKVLLFAFTEDLPRNPYAPHNHIPNCVLYTGTHDNNTARGWFESEASDAEKDRFCKYIGREIGVEEVSWELLRMALSSVANVAMAPMQDLLGLGQAARMNIPSVPDGNWEWRVLSEQLSPELAQKFCELVRIYNR